ncbi:MAG TPA: RDD family protein [Bryobacteraceae bacterium]|nr:RDD family protein [Bryobacteraceae bacterium]
MNCQHCQTWILDDDHRCSRCGRRVRFRPTASQSFPISSGATAHAYDFARQAAPAFPEFANPEPTAAEAAQQALFSNPNPERVIAFESLTTPAERQSIRARAADLGRTADAPRPDPLKQAKVELPRPRGRKKVTMSQQSFELFGADELMAPPQSHIICDAPVAPPGLRLEAALIDAGLMLCPILAGLAFFFYEGGRLSFDRHLVPFWLAAFLTIPVLYKTIWACANRDTIGMSCTGLRLVDFDGNPPSVERRYQRLFGSLISVLAAGIGLVWALVDEDALAWHDHISNTFPTIDSDI